MAKKKTKRAKKPRDILKLKATALRYSLLRRGKKHGVEDTTPTRDELWEWLKKQELFCHYSYVAVSIKELNIDHKIPLHRRGNNSLANLCITSRKMNTAKGSMTDGEFKELLSFISLWEDKGEYLLRRLRQGHF